MPFRRGHFARVDTVPIGMFMLVIMGMVVMAVIVLMNRIVVRMRV